MKRYCLACDLNDDDELIKEYEAYHRDVWPENIQGIIDSGIVEMDIYRIGNRLFMIMETNDDFSFESKALSDAANEKVVEWERLMLKYQQPLPGAPPGEKWTLMNKIFEMPK